MLIYRVSRGIPRIINLICENSLILAYVEQFEKISVELVAAVIHDLDLDGTAAMLSSGSSDSFVGKEKAKRALPEFASSRSGSFDGQEPERDDR